MLEELEDTNLPQCSHRKLERRASSGTVKLFQVLSGGTVLVVNIVVVSVPDPHMWESGTETNIVDTYSFLFVFHPNLL